MVVESGADLIGFGFVIEKTFAHGRNALTRFGVPIVTLAPIDSMNPEDGSIVFVEDPA